ncbi:MAG: P1 family peptidase [Candidatus Geothermincolia bacterium]
MLSTVRVGHAGDREALTGCTVFFPPEGSTAACEVRGGAPGTRETEMLSPTFTVQCPNAILLAGGSAFGLNAATGVMRYLEEQGVGFPTPGGLVPIVSAAVIFDLDVGDGSVRPDAEMGYNACVAASTEEESEGSVGVGLGASVGNVYGRARSTRGGFGIYRFHADGFKLEVAAVVNAYGDVVDSSGQVLGGVRGEKGGFVGAEKAICNSTGLAPGCLQNTTLVVVATNAKLSCTEGARVALQGHNGIARAVRPSHTRYDGDTVFVIATGEVEAPQDAIEALAAMGTAEALRSGVMRATAGGGIPCASDILGP